MFYGGDIVVSNLSGFANIAGQFSVNTLSVTANSVSLAGNISTTIANINVSTSGSLDGTLSCSSLNLSSSTGSVNGNITAKTFVNFTVAQSLTVGSQSIVASGSSFSAQGTSVNIVGAIRAASAVSMTGLTLNMPSSSTVSGTTIEITTIIAQLAGSISATTLNISSTGNTVFAGSTSVNALNVTVNSGLNIEFDAGSVISVDGGGYVAATTGMPLP